jgi:hypothetical protein
MPPSPRLFVPMTSHGCPHPDKGVFPSPASWHASGRMGVRLGPRDPSISLLACVHETAWASARPGWIHPLPCLPAPKTPHGCPRRSERCILPAHAGTHPVAWACPWHCMDTRLRGMRAPMQPHGCLLPVDAGARRADAGTDPWQRMVPSPGRAHPRAGWISPYDGIGTSKPTTRAPMQGHGCRNAGQRMAPCRRRLGPSARRARASGSSVSGWASLDTGKPGKACADARARTVTTRELSSRP